VDNNPSTMIDWAHAINNRLLVSFRYDGYERLVIPAAYGLNQNTGNRLVRGYQVGGGDGRGEFPRGAFSTSTRCKTARSRKNTSKTIHPAISETTATWTSSMRSSSRTLDTTSPQAVPPSGVSDRSGCYEVAVTVDPPDLENLKDELLRVASIADPTERLLEVAAVISEALSDLGVQPVVVGGLALAYWSDSNKFITGDIDVVVPRVPELADRLRTLGFSQQGREWTLPGHDVAFEAPAEVLEPGDDSTWVQLASGRRVKILAIEDMLLWRLREWVHWHHASGFQQAAHLLVTDEIDTARLDRRAGEEGLSHALRELRRLAAEVEAGRVVEEWEINELGKDVERQSYSPESDG
jgi:hypothetical protein